MKNIYIVGFMGTGKSIVAKLLSENLNKEFIETDEVIEEQEQMNIVDIFRIKGEPYFRKLESNLAFKLSGRQDLVVSCGGGLVCNSENLKLLKSSGIVCALGAKTKVIYDRIKGQSHRPLLNVADPMGEIERLLSRRLEFYNQAHHTIATDTLSPKEVVDKILEVTDCG
jgi:shikimate kinase